LYFDNEVRKRRNESLKKEEVRKMKESERFIFLYDWG